MATALDKEGEDLTTCSVCFEQYSVETRLPKCLPFSHLVCLPCLKVSNFIKSSFN